MARVTTGNPSPPFIGRSTWVSPSSTPPTCTDGATTNQYRAIIDFLSELQFLSAGISKAAAAPVEMPEFQEAVQRAVLFFNTLETDDRQDSARMAAAWIVGMMQKSEPVIWARCVKTLQQHEILSSPLAVEIGITLYAVADAFSRRLASLAAPAPSRRR